MSETTITIDAPAAGRPGDHIARHFMVRNSRLRYSFDPVFHPYVSRLLSRLTREGFDAFEEADTDVRFFEDFFTALYHPVTDSLEDASVETTDKKGKPYPAKRIDFGAGAAYSVYNWELFFHVPFTVAVNLSKNQRYADAQRWFHFVFDPTAGDNGPGTQRYWKVQPFREEDPKMTVSGLLFKMSDETQKAIAHWAKNPFEPHAIARTRPIAYMYKVVMAYLDNLVAWGDSLFRQDTSETINEALQIYMLAASLLGPSPQEIPAARPPATQTYESLEKDLDAFGNAKREIEAEVPFMPALPGGTGVGSPPLGPYFCIPRNERLAGYWNTVADRLFKIRNSRSIDGTYRQVDPYDPPIDPGVLARAVAAGVDVAALVSGTEASVAPVRFPAQLQRAIEVCNEVKSLGAHILAAMEKQDGEALGLLRAKHEATLLTLGKTVRYAQWQEAVKSREAAERSLEGPLVRRLYYERLLGRAPESLSSPKWDPIDTNTLDSEKFKSQEPAIRPRDVAVDIDPNFKEGGRKLTRAESHELSLMAEAQTATNIAGELDTIGAFLSLLPNFATDIKLFGIGPGLTFGGSNLHGLFSALSAAARTVASRISYEASLAGRMAGFERREQDWALQSALASNELSQLYKQLRAAELREEIARREYQNFQKQIANAEDVVDFLSNAQRKQTSSELYLWMKREAKGLYAQYFQFAYDLAKRAEQALRYELGDDRLSFIRTGYLAGQEGLFAGEKLWLDLKRLELAHQELDKRELELTKHISLREWFPDKLLEFRRVGHTEIEVEEQLFDLDCPGHTFRRVKSAALSIPCVVGPYANVNCRVSLSNSMVRRGSDKPVADRAGTIAIVTSSAQNDAGLFEVNLRDDRYLPFEKCGVIGKWSFALLGTPHPFDYGTISDVILTLRYTARPDGGSSQQGIAANTWLAENGATLLSVPHDFPSEWASFTNAPPVDGRWQLLLPITQEHHCFRLRDHLKGDASLKLRTTTNVPDNATVTLGDGLPQKFGDGTLIELKDRIGMLKLSFSTNMVDNLWLIIGGKKKP